MKGKKLLRVIAAIFVLVVILANVYNVYAAEKRKLSISSGGSLRNRIWSSDTSRPWISRPVDGNYTYVANDIPVIKIFDVTNGSNPLSKEEIIYCLRSGIGFHEDGNDGGYADKEYTRHGTLAADTIIDDYAGAPNSAARNSLLWLVDNMYIVQYDDKNATNRKEFLDKVFEWIDAAPMSEGAMFKGLSSATYEGNGPNDEAKLAAFNEITDDDIEVAQQWAIWYFTNSDNSTYHGTPPNLGNGELQMTDDYTNSVDSFLETMTERRPGVLTQFGYERGRVENELTNMVYKYLVSGALAHTGPKETVKIEFDHSLPNSAARNGTVITAGPFDINRTGNAPTFSRQGKIYNQNGIDITHIVEIVDINGDPIENSKKVDPNNATKSVLDIDVLMDNNFYVKMLASDVSYNSVKSITLKLSYQTGSSNSDVWVVEDPDPNVETEQPVLILDPERAEEEDEIDPVLIAQFDLALTKQITKVSGLNGTVNIPRKTENLEVDVAHLRDFSDVTADYNLRKNSNRSNVRRYCYI